MTSAHLWIAEYISTLEGDIAERDRILDAIRTELRTTSDENKALRQEIDALKKALLEGRADTPMLPPPAPLWRPFFASSRRDTLLNGRRLAL